MEHGGAAVCSSSLLRGFHAFNLHFLSGISSLLDALSESGAQREDLEDAFNLLAKNLSSKCTREGMTVMDN